MEFDNLKGQPGSDITIRDLGLQTDFAVYLQIRQTWLAFSTELHIFSTFSFCRSLSVSLMNPLRCFAVIILAIVEVVIILLLIFLRKRLLIAIALIKEASKSVSTL